MKPKKQIDFLVEEFFNTGKLDLNKDEEGITFDQLELLSEQDEEAAEVTFSDIQDAVDSLNISTPTTDQLNFLERPLTPKECESIDNNSITDEDIVIDLLITHFGNHRFYVPDWSRCWYDILIYQDY